MAYAAITYDIKPGFQDEITQLLGEFRRAGDPVIRDEDGNPVAKMLGTAVFMRDDLMVRVIHYEGDLQAVARRMGSAPGVQEVERKLKPFLASPRDTGTVDGFVRTFNECLLDCVAQLSS